MCILFAYYLNTVYLWRELAFFFIYEPLDVRLNIGGKKIGLFSKHHWKSITQYQNEDHTKHLLAVEDGKKSAGSLGFIDFSYKAALFRYCPTYDFKILCQIWTRLVKVWSAAKLIEIYLFRSATGPLPSRLLCCGMKKSFNLRWLFWSTNPSLSSILW